MVIAKKVAFSVPLFMKEILETDKMYFDMELGKILNKLIEYYSSKKIGRFNMIVDAKSKIQFNLNTKNTEMYFKILNENNFQVESEYMRSLVFDYINNPRHKREEIVFYDIVKQIKQAQKENKKLNISYNGVVRTVNPYGIKYSKEESRLYLFCYCEKNNDYRSYRLNKITYTMVSSDDLEIKDEKFIANMLKNFDPFRSYGKSVKVKLTSIGEEILEKAVFNRPKFKKEKDVYVFECDEKLAQIYFAQFYNELEVIEPLSLREWFKKKYEDTNKIYK